MATETKVFNIRLRRFRTDKIDKTYVWVQGFSSCFSGSRQLHFRLGRMSKDEIKELIFNGPQNFRIGKKFILAKFYLTKLLRR